MPRRGSILRATNLTDAERQEIEDAFDLFAEGRGKIDCFEFKVALKALGFPASRAHVRNIFETHDIDPHAMVKSEFIREVAFKFNARDLDKEIKRAFVLFDVDGTGAVTVENLQHVVRELGEDIDTEELYAMVSEFDYDRDGAISRAEFSKIMKTTSTFGT